LVSALVAALALIVSLFVKEVPLRQTTKPRRGGRATQAGDELAVELGQAEAKDEPALAAD
jgi:hypothetical protein